MEDLLGYEDLYTIDQVGRIWSKERFKFVRPRISRGCHVVSLTNSNGSKQKLVHQLVAKQFLPNPLNARCVRHINDVKIDNRVGNLQWRMPKPKKQQKPVPANMVPITGYEGLYSINLEGQVWSDRRSHYLKPSNHKGYLKVSLYKDGCSAAYGIHRLLGLQFLPNPSNLPEVDHMNTNNSDNRLSNLRWATCSTNSKNQSLSKANKLGVQGVRWLPKSQRFQAMWNEDGKLRSKCFKTLEEAAALRNLKVALLYNRPELPPPKNSNVLTLPTTVAFTDNS